MQPMVSVRVSYTCTVCVCVRGGTSYILPHIVTPVYVVSPHSSDYTPSAPPGQTGGETDVSGKSSHGGRGRGGGLIDRWVGVVGVVFYPLLHPACALLTSGRYY